MKVLVTGGAGYIGSHTVLALLERGHDVAVVDNFANSSEEPLQRVRAMTGKDVPLFVVDACDQAALENVIAQFLPEAIIHFAGFKAVGESAQNPLKYYENNLLSTIQLSKVAVKTGVNKLIFSSSATVYGQPDEVPVTEAAPLRPANPYGHTKLMCEQILSDAVSAHTDFSATVLRYFNPIGAHPSGQIGEDPHDIPNNLLPFVAQVAVGRREKLKIFGNDYDTPDGTGVRDYLHVCDLAEGHVAALEHMQKSELATYNLGTGQGCSVLEVVHAFEQASGQQIPYEVVPRRAGDVAIYYADPAKAEKELGWRAKKTLEQMCADTYKWQSTNPNGYQA